MKRWLSRSAGWLLAILAFGLRITLRARFVDDCRPKLSEQGIPHVFAVLHAHQLSGLAASDPGMAIMVSRSADGEIVVPLIRMFGHEPIRGSSGPQRKGGSSALRAMAQHVQNGKNAIVTVDGPRGPRGHAKKGIGLLARDAGAAIVCAVVIPKRRRILERAWDRLQIPLPFTRLTVAMSPPIYFDHADSLENFAVRVSNQLHELENQYDPAEAATSAAFPAMITPPGVESTPIAGSDSKQQQAAA